MNTLNLNLNLNLNSVLVLLPVLPRHLQKCWCALLSAVCMAKKNRGVFERAFFSIRNKRTESGLGFHGGPVSSYPTTTRRLVIGRKSSGAKSFDD